MKTLSYGPQGRGDAEQTGYVELRPRTRAEMRERQQENVRKKREQARREKEHLQDRVSGAVGTLIAHVVIPHYWLVKAGLAVLDQPDPVELRFDPRDVRGVAVGGAVLGLGLGALVGNGEPLAGALIGAALGIVLGVALVIRQKDRDREAEEYHWAYCRYVNRRGAEVARAKAAGEIQEEKRSTLFWNAVRGKENPLASTHASVGRTDRKRRRPTVEA